MSNHDVYGRAAIDPPIWARGRLPATNHMTRFADNVKALSAMDLLKNYELDRNLAPRRGLRLKSHFEMHRDGFPRCDLPSNRREEHLMIALFNSGALNLPNGSALRVIDYQTPLKARQSDRTGKIDGIGLLPDGSLCLMELKSPKTGNGDSPLRALLESVAYAAVVEANREQFVTELTVLSAEHARFKGFVAGDLTLLVLGTQDWWRKWETSPKAGDWKKPLASLTEQLSKGIGHRIAYGALSGIAFSDEDHGTRSKKPQVIGTPRLVPVAELPALL